MYPCSNPELVAAVSEAGGLGVIQPVSLTYVCRYELRAGLRHIRSLTSRPVGFNALIEASNRAYLERMRQWIDIALEEGIRFFITSLGDPKWVCERVHAAGGFVYHDVTEARWARKGAAGGVDGLIGVNARAGGDAGSRTPEALLEELRPFGLPVVAAGGVGTAEEFARLIGLGYAAVQLGTRFIATTECTASAAYKQAIVAASRGGHRADRAIDRRAGGGDPQCLRRTTGNPGRPVRALDAAGPPAQALDAHAVHPQLGAAAAQVAVLRGHQHRLLAGGPVGGGIHSVLPAAAIVSEYAAALKKSTEGTR